MDNKYDELVKIIYLSSKISTSKKASNIGQKLRVVQNEVMSSFIVP